MTRAAARHSAVASEETSKMQRQKSACGAGLATPSSCASGSVWRQRRRATCSIQARTGGLFASGASLPSLGFPDLLLRRLCRRWKGGTCRFGSNCNFAHGEEELRRLPPRGEAYGGGGLARGQGRFVGGDFDAGFNSEQGFAQARPGVRLSPAGLETRVWGRACLFAGAAATGT